MIFRRGHNVSLATGAQKKSLAWIRSAQRKTISHQRMGFLFFKDAKFEMIPVQKNVMPSVFFNKGSLLEGCYTQCFRPKSVAIQQLTKNREGER